MTEQNFPDNVLDNLDVLRGMNSETVNLVTLPSRTCTDRQVQIRAKTPEKRPTCPQKDQIEKTPSENA